MATKTKIKINDDNSLRFVLDSLYESTNHGIVVKWAILLAGHVLDLCNLDIHFFEQVFDGICINQSYQCGKESLYTLRQAGFDIAKLAREQSNIIYKAGLRSIGHAVSSAHMKQHAMVASDYAIRVVNLTKPNNFDAVKNERIWQIESLKKIV